MSVVGVTSGARVIGVIWCLCNDGTMWQWGEKYGVATWIEIAGPPQPEIEEEPERATDR